MPRTIFLHGLDSSGYGTKGRYFSEHFPSMLRPDFDGTLQERMERLFSIVSDLSDLIVVGSSFGGLMAACLALEQPDKIRRLILLAPALNFEQYHPPVEKSPIETLLVIGTYDTVTPPGLVIPAAEATFAELRVQRVEDDHLLHQTFQNLDWPLLLS